MTISLSKFCKEHGIPKSSVHARCKELGILTANGLDDKAQQILMHEFGLSQPTPLETLEACAPEGKLTITVETGNHSKALDTPKLPDQYSLEGLRTTESEYISDPLALADQFLEVADAIMGEMDSDISERQKRLRKTQDARSKIEDKAHEFRLKRRIYKEQTILTDSALNTETTNLQEALKNLSSLGKPLKTPSESTSQSS